MKVSNSNLILLFEIFQLTANGVHGLAGHTATSVVTERGTGLATGRSHRVGENTAEDATTKSGTTTTVDGTQSILNGITITVKITIIMANWRLIHMAD